MKTRASFSLFPGGPSPRPGAGACCPACGSPYARAHETPGPLRRPRCGRGRPRPRPRGRPRGPSRPSASGGATAGDPGHTQYSPLDQIDTSNVDRLEVAWTYRTGDARDEGRSQIQCNPIVVDGVLYATIGPGGHLRAGRRHRTGALALRPLRRPGPRSCPSGWGPTGASPTGASGDDRRILVTAGQSLFALDARTGKPCRASADSGSVDLREGLGRDASELFVTSSTPGAVYRDLLILGTRVHEGPGPSAPGHVRAYDVRTGAIRWTFRTIPQPGELGYDTWPPDAWKDVGGANAWSGISVDHERGLVFLPTGSPAFDFWGGDRHGANLFGNCLLVLKAATGERVWHFQTVHHDLWDRDLPQAPVLVTVTRDGRARSTRWPRPPSRGTCSCSTGRPGSRCSRSRSGPFPASDLIGEKAWPTQPIPVKPPPFARQVLDRGGRDRHLPGGAGGGPGAAARGAQRRPVRAPERPGDGDLPGLRRRGGVGRLGLRPGDAPPLRQLQRDGVDPPDARASPRRGGGPAGRPRLRPALHRLPRGRQEGRPPGAVPTHRRPRGAPDAARTR